MVRKARIRAFLARDAFWRLRAQIVGFLCNMEAVDRLGQGLLPLAAQRLCGVGGLWGGLCKDLEDSRGIAEDVESRQPLNANTPLEPAGISQLGGYRSHGWLNHRKWRAGVLPPAPLLSKPG